MRELRGPAVIAAKWVVVIVAVLAAGIPISAVSAYHVGIQQAPANSPPSWFNQTLILNGSHPAPSSNFTVILVPTSDTVSSFAIAFASPVLGDFCVSVVNPFGSIDYGACTTQGTQSRNQTAGAIAIQAQISNYYSVEPYFAAYIPSGGASLVTFRWWANSTYGPVVGGAGSLFVPAGAPGASQRSLEVPVTDGIGALMVTASSTSVPFTMVVTGAFCCQRSIGAPSESWTWTGGYLGSGYGIIEIAWTSSTQFSVAVAVEMIRAA